MSNQKQQETPPITFVAAGDTELEREAVLEEVLPSPGFPAVAQLVVDAIEKRSEVTVLDFTPQQVNIRFQIDNVWHTMPNMDRETGDFMLATLKRMAGVDYRNRRAHQEGSFRAEYMRVKHSCQIISQGVRTGERIALYIELPKSKAETLERFSMASTTNWATAGNPGDGRTSSRTASRSSSVSPAATNVIGGVSCCFWFDMDLYYTA